MGTPCAFIAVAVSVEGGVVIPAHLIHINEWNFILHGIVC